MQIVSANIVRGSAQPGLEVVFRGEGGESVSIHLKGEDVSSLSDAEVIARAKEMLIDLAAGESGQPA
jgi:hypothetical protein